MKILSNHGDYYEVLSNHKTKFELLKSSRLNSNFFETIEAYLPFSIFKILVRSKKNKKG